MAGTLERLESRHAAIPDWHPHCSDARQEMCSAGEGLGGATVPEVLPSAPGGPTRAPDPQPQGKGG